MSSIPLPALNIHPPQAPADPLEQYGKLMQMQQMGLQMQREKAQNQMIQQKAQDQQKVLGFLSQNPGSSYADAAKALHGQIGLDTHASLMEEDTKIQETLGKADETKFKNFQSQQQAYQSIYNNVMNMPDDQVQQSWPQIAQAINSVPGGTLKLDPAQPKGKAELQQFGPMLALNDKYLAAETEKRLKKAQLGTAESEATIKGAEATSMQQGGMTQAMADSRYRVLQERLAKKIPLSPDDQAFIKGYEKQKLLVPSTTAQIRVEGYGKIRQFPVYDTQTKQTVYMDSNEINDAKLKEPGRYTVPQYSAEPIIQKKTAETFAPGGKAGEELNAFNTAKLHADLLAQASEALQNGDVKALNSANNALKTQFGEAGVTNYRVIANAYSREVTKALSAGHLTNQEIQDQGATMPANASPAQIVGAVKAYRDLMQSKINIRKQGYEAGQQGKPNFGQAAPAQGATKVYQGQTYIQQADGSWKKQ